MDFKLIKTIIDTQLLSDKEKERLILKHISDSENAITYVLMLLNAERKNNKDLISDLNEVVSIGSVFVGKNKLVKKPFLQKKYIDFYEKWKDRISNRFLNWDNGYEKPINQKINS
jgi:hypothetical protein